MRKSLVNGKLLVNLSWEIELGGDVNEMLLIYVVDSVTVLAKEVAVTVCLTAEGSVLKERKAPLLLLEEAAMRLPESLQAPLSMILSIPPLLRKPRATIICCVHAQLDRLIWCRTACWVRCQLPFVAQDEKLVLVIYYCCSLLFVCCCWIMQRVFSVVSSRNTLFKHSGRVPNFFIHQYSTQSTPLFTSATHVKDALKKGRDFLVSIPKPNSGSFFICICI